MLALVTLRAVEASACLAAISCEAEVLALRGRVPANLPALGWTPLGSSVDPYRPGQALRVRRVDGDEVPIAVEAWAAWPRGRLLRFGTALDADAQYELVADTPCARSTMPTVVRFETGPAAPLPTRLGTLVVGAPYLQTLVVSLPSSFSTCHTIFEAVTHTVHVALSPEAEPWRNAFIYETRVDGNTWHWQRDRNNRRPAAALPDVYMPCAARDGGNVGSVSSLSPGMHTVTVTAFLPGTETRFSVSAPVDLRCPTVDADSGVSTNASDESGGCSTRPGRGAGFGGCAAACIALGLAGRRRRGTRSA